MAQESYKTLYKYASFEIEIKKSKFIGHAKPVSCEYEAIKFIDEIKANNRLASHNVYAYTIGNNNEIQRYNDDKEPSGTAGLPVLNVIKLEGLKNVAIVVTRYFGGILLGTGGLARAYSKAARGSIEAAEIVEKVPFHAIDIIFDYTLLGKLQNYLTREGYFIKNIDYTDKVIMIVYVEKIHLNNFINLINDLTNKTAEIKIDKDVYLFKKDNYYIE